ncbi:single-strand DNA-binding protein [Natranaerovirga hydrolytica]|uniref:Single-stranded DNA-binding protein n=1 Tax=Natranaerovirga hydrolytica TaxID=680378 RepID=A0A4R1N1C0_9FIRM|nr:single-stranded DNA-binding protein [Natranaerovirga hydrolytica]TCK99736.1 single-strand DNA-binding protein [Natranaerovirga hydrolytica]
MNKVILMGRLTRDPEVRYSQGSNPIAIARYSLAVNRVYKREGEPDADFINIVSFGKAGEFAGRYFKKGQMVAVSGRLQIRTYDDQDGKRQYFTEVITEDQYFAESKKSTEEYNNNTPSTPAPSEESADGFMPIDNSFEDEDDLPF